MSPDSIALSIIVPVALVVIHLLIRWLIILYDQLHVCEREIKAGDSRLLVLQKELIHVRARNQKLRKELQDMSLRRYRSSRFVRWPWTYKHRMMAMEELNLVDD